MMLLKDPSGHSIRPRWAVLAAPVAVAALVVSAGVTPAAADPLPSGPDTCLNGFVWRAARPGDAVCVPPDMRTTIAQQNGDPGAHKDPNGAFGPESCAQGFVWREAFDGDVICVTPEFRTQVKSDNAAAETRKAANNPDSQIPAQTESITFEVTGSGTVYSIVTDPVTSAVGEGATAPWKRTFTMGSNDRLYQVVVTTKDGAQGCRITLNGTVVAEQPIGNSPHCSYTGH
jgi:hypothetical protein